MKRSTDRILTTHVGSLPRPHALLDTMRARVGGEAYDDAAWQAQVKQTVADVVRKQAECGVDVVDDGEVGKVGFFAYVRERLSGFEPGPPDPDPYSGRGRELRAFPEYYARYLGRRTGPRIGTSNPVQCIGPVRYTGEAALQTDIANLKAAMQGLNVVEGFMPAIAPRGVGRNHYYKTEEEYTSAVADAMHEEYVAIVNAGLVLQVDDAWLTSLYGADESIDLPVRRREAEKYVELLNHALRDIPAESVRFHTCYGINEGPRVYDVPFEDFIDIMLQVNAGAYSFEAANPRHYHEWHLWERFKLPEGKSLIPGVISHSTNVVEHPEFIADLLCNYASLVGRDAVIAGADCGFSSNASYDTDVEDRVVWAKFQSLSEGAALASKRLWAK
jgi:5-methyltetrahydropteroyltriglutamate--homocysteine methyltransferase